MTTTLSAREGAGLYLVRRARTLTAPHQLRLLATAFVGVLLVDLGRIHLQQLQAGAPVSWPALGCETLTYLAVALVMWHRLAGLCVAGLALSVSLAAGGTGLEPALLLIVGVVVGVRGTRRLLWLFVLGVGCLMAASVSLHPEHTGFVLGWFGGAGATGTVLGLVGRTVGRSRDRGGRQLAEIAVEDARIRDDERRLLARELHDVVTHQLSNISLQVMGHLDDGNAEDLRRVLKKVARSSDSALTELRLLVRVLRDYAPVNAGVDDVGELSRRLAPTIAAARWSRQLTEAGFDPAIDIPGQCDRLEMTVQATVTRTLDVVCDNIVRHAPARSWCTITVSVNPTQVVVRAANPLPSPAPEAANPLGWGLRGLRERVDLTGGTFSAGMSGSPTAEPQWVVVVTLPHD